MREEMKFVVKEIKIGELHLDPIRGPEVLDDALVETLAKSFDSVSMLQLPVVRKIPRGQGRGYWVISGWHRWKAARKDQDRSSLKCRVVVCDDEMAREIFLRENLERSHLPVEERMARRQELTGAIASREQAERFAPGRAFHLKNAARATGVSTRTIERDDRFIEQLIPDALDALRQRRISVRQAEELCGMGDVHQAAELPELMRTKAEGKVRKATVTSAPVDERRPVTADTANERVSVFVSAIEEIVKRDLFPLLVLPELKDALVDVEPTVIEQMSNVFRWLGTLVARLPADVVMHSKVLSEVLGSVASRRTTQAASEDSQAGVEKAPESPIPQVDSTRARGKRREQLIPGLRRNKVPVAPSN